MIALYFINPALLLFFLALTMNSRQALSLLSALVARDSRRGAWQSRWQVLSRFLWELPQSYLGFCWAMVLLIGKRIDSVQTEAGACIIYSEKPKQKWILGMSLSPYIFISGAGKRFDLERSSFFMHEYGHLLDSQRLEPIYLLAVFTVR